jgi:hypothetical protein
VLAGDKVVDGLPHAMTESRLAGLREPRLVGGHGPLVLGPVEPSAQPVHPCADKRHELLAPRRFERVVTVDHGNDA